MNKARKFRLNKMTKRRRIIYALAIGKSREQIIDEVGVTPNFIRQVIWQLRHLDQVLTEGRNRAKAARAAQRVNELEGLEP